jgi:hypothetical protein
MRVYYTYIANNLTNTVFVNLIIAILFQSIRQKLRLVAKCTTVCTLL